MSSDMTAPEKVSEKPSGSRESSDLVALIEKHDIHVFRPSNYRFDPRTLVLPDDFFNSTLADVKDASSRLTERVRDMNDAPLMTKKMREAEENAKMSRFRKVMIRILLPDRHSLQGVFEPKSTILDVTNFVKACLNEQVKFHLFLVPPKTVLKDMQATLWQQKLVPAAQIYLGVDEGPASTAELLKESVLTLAQDAPPPKVMAPPAEPAAPAGRTTGTGKPAKSAGASKAKSKIIPKWLKKK